MLTYRTSCHLVAAGPGWWVFVRLQAEQPMSPRGYEVQPGYLDSLEKELFTARSKQVISRRSVFQPRRYSGLRPLSPPNLTVTYGDLKLSGTSHRSRESGALGPKLCVARNVKK
eukprot:4758459-Amphidinium_carterae.1